ncbi:MAG: tetratricopeptide repeat protein [Planctomycetes bacterium]|nr:tetratricopeptide repeat protein [Planctomycetota bacterium]
MALFRQASALLAGRWQVPLAVCAVTLGGLTLYRLKPVRLPISFEALVADVGTLTRDGEYVNAADGVANLLEMQPPLPLGQQARLHDSLAEIVYQQESQRGIPNPGNLKVLLQHQAEAERLGFPRSASSAVRLAQTQEWLGLKPEARAAYRDVLKQDAPSDVRRQALQGLVKLLGDPKLGPKAEAERKDYLRELMADEGASPSYLWWALQQTMQDALDQNDTVRARQLLYKHGEQLKSSDLKGYYEYLWAWVMVHEGRTEEAAPLVEWIDDWLGQHARDESRLGGCGYLPALNRWLLGKIHLAEGRPQEALAAFENAEVLQPYGDLLVAATVGRGQALSMLERHEAALESFRDALLRLRSDQTALMRGVLRFRESLLGLFEQQRAAGNHGSAAEYLALVVELTPEEAVRERLGLLETLGEAYAGAAQGTSDPEQRRQHEAKAGQSYYQAAHLDPDTPQKASLLSLAAQHYDAAGRLADVRRVLQEFADNLPSDTRMPQVLLRLGQAFEADGYLENAYETYQRLAQSFPKLEEAARARVLSANCLLAMGGERAPEAQAILLGLLNDENVAPDAMVFHDALFTLCDLLYQQGRYAEAIGRLEDFLGLYPEDAERYRARFLLADAYRRSACALRDAPPADVTPERAAEQSKTRFRQAARLFELFLEDVGELVSADETVALYERLALFYRGDCLFELNEPETLQQALLTYQQAAARYERSPAALTAQVQLVNIHLRLGQVAEAARALERARWLLRRLSTDAFERHADGTDRAYWERYLAAVSSSHLFRDVLAGAR